MILTQVNRSVLVEALNAPLRQPEDEKRFSQLLGELNYAWHSCKWADSLFKEAIKEMKKIRPKIGANDDDERAENAVRELRLATCLVCRKIRSHFRPAN